MSEDAEKVVLTEEDKGMIRAFLQSLYGNQASSFTINNKLAEIVAEIIKRLENCGGAMDYVPSPAGITKPGLKYLRNQLLKMVKKTADRHIFEVDKTTIPCRNFIKAFWATKVHMTQY